jgi:predicted amidohydrolase YtcJ
MRQPYNDLGTRGMLNFPVDTVRAILTECVTRGLQPILHIVGDSATAVVLSLMSEVAPDSAWRRLRPRIEHGEGATAELIPELIRKGVIVVQNPSHFAVVGLFDSRWGTERRAASSSSSRTSRRECRLRSDPMGRSLRDSTSCSR